MAGQDPVNKDNPYWPPGVGGGTDVGNMQWVQDPNTGEWRLTDVANVTGKDPGGGGGGGIPLPGGGGGDVPKEPDPNNQDQPPPAGEPPGDVPPPVDPGGDPGNPPPPIGGGNPPPTGGDGGGTFTGDYQLIDPPGYPFPNMADPYQGIQYDPNQSYTQWDPLGGLRPGGGIDPYDPNQAPNPGAMLDPTDSFQRQGYSDPYSVYLSTVPVMQQAQRDAVNSAMAQAGLTGNRFSSSSQRAAGDIGARTALQQQQMLQQLLYNQSNEDINRQYGATQFGLGLGQQDLQNQLAAAGQLSGLGGLLDQIQGGRLNSLMGAGAQEQQRGDQQAQQAYQDFISGRLGYLPQILAYTGATGQPYSPDVAMQQQGPGLLQYVSAALPWLMAAGVGPFSAMSDERLKEDIEPISDPVAKLKALHGYTWNWLGTGVSDGGVLAQEVERVAPEFVYEAPGAPKMVSVTGLLGILAEATKAILSRVEYLEAGSY